MFVSAQHKPRRRSKADPQFGLVKAAYGMGTCQRRQPIGRPPEGRNVMAPWIAEGDGYQSGKTLESGIPWPSSSVSNRFSVELPLKLSLPCAAAIASLIGRFGLSPKSSCHQKVRKSAVLVLRTPHLIDRRPVSRPNLCD